MKTFILLLVAFVFVFGCIQYAQEQQQEKIASETGTKPVSSQVDDIIQQTTEGTVSPKEEGKSEAGYTGPFGDVNFRYKGCGPNMTVSEFQGYKFSKIQVRGTGYVAVFCKDFACADYFELGEGETKPINGICLRINTILKGYVLCNDYLAATIFEC